MIKINLKTNGIRIYPTGYIFSYVIKKLLSSILWEKHVSNAELSLSDLHTVQETLHHTVTRLSYSVDLLSRATFIRSWMHHCADMPLSCSPHKRTMSIICARLLHRWCTRAFSHPYRRGANIIRRRRSRSGHHIQSPSCFLYLCPGSSLSILYVTLRCRSYWFSVSRIPLIITYFYWFSQIYRKFYCLNSLFCRCKFVSLSDCLILDFRRNSQTKLCSENTLATVHFIDFVILLILLTQTKTGKRNRRKSD